MTEPATLPGSEQESPGAVMRRLDAVFAAAGLPHQPLIHLRGTSLVVTLFMDDGGPLTVADTDLLPTPQAAAGFQAVLGGQGIKATVTTAPAEAAQPALVITLTSAADANRLTDLIRRTLPAPHVAADRLQAVLTAAGIETKGIHVSRGEVRIGDITAHHARALGEMLRGSAWGRTPDPDDWRDLHRLAYLLTEVLHSITGARVLIDPHPACDRCGRTHELTLGPVSKDTAHRLADAVEDAIDARHAEHARSTEAVFTSTGGGTRP